MTSDDEPTGYKRPPKKTRFRPGQSGNPSGKAKGLRSISSELQDILSEQVTYTADGAIKTMSKQRALASALVTAAIGGDFRATAIVMGHLVKEKVENEDVEEFKAVRAHQKRIRQRNEQEP